MRRSIGIATNPTNNTYRLVHGEGDNLPGLVIDVYAKTAVMQAHSAGMHVDRMTIAEALSEVMGDKIENIYYKSETTLPFKADLFPENGFLKGGSSDNIAQEYGLKFHVDWLKGQKTGFFVDQRENRSLLEHYAKDRSVLNMFCYTGGFSFYARHSNIWLFSLFGRFLINNTFFILTSSGLKYLLNNPHVTSSISIIECVCAHTFA